MSKSEASRSKNRISEMKPPPGKATAGGNNKGVPPAEPKTELERLKGDHAGVTKQIAQIEAHIEHLASTRENARGVLAYCTAQIERIEQATTADKK